MMKIKFLYTLIFCLLFFAITTNAQNSLAVKVFHDIDGNGLEGGGEPIIAGVLATELRLWQDIDNNGAITGPDILFTHDGGAGGIYTFGTGNLLPNDNYILDYVETGGPGTYYVTKLVNGVGISDNDNDVDPMSNTAGFPLSGDTPETFIDLGLVIAGNIGSFVWEDIDGDGIQDGGEPGINGVNVTLLDAVTMAAVTNDIDFTALTNPTVTAAGGMYSFDNLPPGQYIVEFSVPAPSPDPWYPTKVTVNTDATDPSNDSDAENNPGAGNYLQSHTIILLSNETDEEDKIDAGFFQSGNIGSFVWEDTDGNGIQDGGEVGIDGVSVTLLDATTMLAVVNDVDFIALVNPVATAAGGMYTFDNLPPGQYIVEFSVPAPSPDPWYPTKVTVNTDATDPTNDSDAENNSGAGNYLQSHTIILLSDETDEEDRIDAGFFQAANIGDWVWEDLNGDGIQDAGELGINGVTVSLLDDTGAPAIGADGLAVPNEVTAGGGIYQFMLVAPGDYQVQFSLPAPIGGVAWYPTEFGVHTDANDPDIDSDANNDPGDAANYLKSHVITIESGETDEELRIDAGFWLPAKVGNKVFCDENGNGVDDDGVGGVDGVDVRLINTSTGATAQDADGNNLTTTSAGGGIYMFELVPPGFYRVEFSFTGTTPDPPFVFTIQDAAIATDFTDSDANTGNGQTIEFEVTSKDIDEELKWDAGVYQVINIFGTIWIEDDANSMYNGESGPGGVFLEIFNATNDNKVDDTFTNSGDYEFIGLPPGNYYISFDVTGTALESATPCPGSNDANDMNDDDDNGTDGIMVQTTNFTLLSNCDANNPPEVFYIDFCYFFDCDQPNPLAATACSEVGEPDIICDIYILGTFCNLMPTANSPGTQPNPLCPDGGGPHNMSWFAFVAYDGDYAVTVTPTGCNGSTTGQEGVQIGLYTDCTFTESVYCDPTCNTNPVTFNSDILEPGQTYYFFIDGCSGSVCSYEVDITGNPIEPNLVPLCVAIDNNGSLDCVDANYCPDALVDFVATDFNLTVDFTWSITTTSGGPFIGNANPMTEDEVLSLSFPNEGVYEICLTQVDNGCASQQWNGNVCRTITIEGIDDEMFDEITVCSVEDFTDPSVLVNMTAANPMDPNGDGTIGWQGGNTFVEGMNMFTVTTPLGCMYDQEFELSLFPESDQGLFEQTYCLGDLPTMIDAVSITELSFAGQTTLVIQDYLLVNETDENGCDSIIDINLEVLTILNGALSQGLCLPEGIIMNFAYNDDILLSTDISFFTFEWIDPNGDPLDDNLWNPLDPMDNLAPVGIGSGLYVLNITVNKNGISCVFNYNVNIDFESLFPPIPNISGPGLEVCESEGLVTYTAVDFGDAFGFTWTYPNDVASATFSGADNEILTINWSGSAGGSVTLVTENACGMSEEVEIIVSVIPQSTPSFDFITEVCVNSCSTIEFIGDPTGLTFSWNFDGGTENNGTGGVGPGPHCISWPTAGIKTITLSYEDNSGCVSTLATETVSVIAPIAPPVVTCNPNTGEVSFTWPDVPGATGYEVEVTSISTLTEMLHEGVLSGTTFTVSNLEDGETAIIILTIFTDDACQMISVTSPGCTSQDCIAPSIVLSSDVTSFCLNSSTGVSIPSGTATITPDIISGENGTGIYVGPGIVDPINGIFDPAAANIGLNTITYNFMTDALPTPCLGFGTIQIEVKETPVASFTSNVDTICITDVFNLTYDGTSGPSIFTWDYGIDGTGNGGPSPTVTFSSPGAKTISLFVEKNDCESESATIDVFVQPELTPIDVICSIQEIDNVQFSWNAVTGATGYSVSVNGGPPFITTGTSHAELGLNPDDIVTLTVTVLTDSRCPGSSDTQACIAKSCPTFTFSYPNESQDVCVNGSNPLIDLQAIASGGIGDGIYSWSGPNVIGAQFDPNGLPEGAYELLVTYEEGGCEDSGSVMVNITTTPTAAFTVVDPTTICVGETVNILYEGSQLANQIISWTPAGTVVAGANPNEYTATFNTIGTFDIQLDVTNGACTTLPDNSTITVEPELVFDVIDCVEELDQIFFSWLPVDCATEYEVFIDSVSQGIQSETEFMVTGLMEGQEVIIEVIAVSGCACGNVMQTRICEAKACNQVDLSLSTMDGITEFCIAPDLSPIEIMPATPGSNGTGPFVWSGSSPDIVDQDGMFYPVAAGVGTHTIIFDYLESVGCSFQESITFIIHDLPSVDQQFDVISCYDQTTTMLEVIPSGGDGNYSITLNGENADLMNDVEAGSYEIVVMDGNLCTATTSVTITTPNEPTPTITGSTELINGQFSNYSISSSLFNGTTIDSIIWTANGTVICNDAGCFSLNNQMPTETTDYVVTIHYNSGCSVSGALTVVVTEPEPVSIVEIPNIISPNGDGDNDVWQIVTNDENVIVNSVQIFDRWGNLVFGFEGPVNAIDNIIVWDGKFNGKILQPGVYVYYLDFDQEGRQNKIRSGDITIIN